MTTDAAAALTDPSNHVSSSMQPDEGAINLNLLLISRRSIERPGLRYQRRGVNSAGGSANFVETEFITSTRVQDKLHVMSFVQTRGSSKSFLELVLQDLTGLLSTPVLVAKPLGTQASTGFGKVDRGERFSDSKAFRHTTGPRQIITLLFSVFS